MTRTAPWFVESDNERAIDLSRVVAWNKQGEREIHVWFGDTSEENCWTVQGDDALRLFDALLALTAPDAPKGDDCPDCGGTGRRPCMVGLHTPQAGVGEEPCPHDAAPDPATEMDNPRRGYELWQQAHAAGLTATDPMWSAYWAGYQQARAYDAERNVLNQRDK